VNKTQIIFYINKYKQNFVPIALYFFGFFIILRILIPQITQFQGVKRDYKEKKDEIALLQTSIKTLSEIDQTALEDTLEILENALPREQDATLIVSSLNAAALRANVEIIGYVLSPGKIYEKQQENADSQGGVTISDSNKTPFQELELQVGSDNISQIIDLAEEFQELVPLSEVSKLSANATDGSFVIRFFYKPFNKEALSKKDFVAPFKTSDLELIAKIKGFNS